MSDATVTKRWSRGLGLGVLLAGALASAAPDTHHLTLRTPRNAFSLQVTDRDLLGPEIQLTHVGTQLRGRMFNSVVFLEVTANQVSGTVGNRLTRLNIREKDGGTEAQGNVLGRLTHLNLSPQALTGNVGTCGYDLKATSEGTYEGSSSCGSIPQQPVVLTLPPALTQQGPAMTLLTLALLLGNG